MIKCTGQANFLLLEFPHYVQRELFGISLTKPGAVARQPYSIEWQLVDGSSVEQCDLYVDGVLDAGVKWDPEALIGKGTFNPQGDRFPGVHSILVNMSNAVSNVSGHFTCVFGFVFIFWSEFCGILFAFEWGLFLWVFILDWSF